MSYAHASAVCIAAKIIGNLDDAIAAAERHGIVMESSDSVLVDQMAGSLEFAEPEYLVNAFPGFSQLMTELVADHEGQYSDFFRDVGERFRCSRLPVVMVDHLLNQLRREDGWKDADDVARQLYEEQGVYLSRNRREFHDYIRDRKLVRVKTCGRYLHPPLSWMLFVYDWEQQEVAVTKEESKTLRYLNRNAEYLRERQFKSVAEVCSLFRERYPGIGIKQSDVLLSAQQGNIAYHIAAGQLFFNHEAVEKVIGFHHARVGQDYSAVQRELAFCREFIAGLPPEIQADFEQCLQAFRQS